MFLVNAAAAAAAAGAHLMRRYFLRLPPATTTRLPACTTRQPLEHSNSSSPELKQGDQVENDRDRERSAAIREGKNSWRSGKIKIDLESQDKKLINNSIKDLHTKSA